MFASGKRDGTTSFSPTGTFPVVADGAASCGQKCLAGSNGVANVGHGNNNQ